MMVLLEGCGKCGIGSGGVIVNTALVVVMLAVWGSGKIVRWSGDKRSAVVVV